MLILRNNVNVIGSHLVEKTTSGKSYRFKRVRIGRWVVGRWIVDDSGTELLISNDTFKKFFTQ